MFCFAFVDCDVVLCLTQRLPAGTEPVYSAAAYEVYKRRANGGVSGRKITLRSKDDQYIPTTTVAKANELSLRDKVFALVGTLGTASTKALTASTQLSKRGIPSLFVNTGWSGFADKKAYPTTFSILPSYQMEAKLMAPYLKDKHEAQKTPLRHQDRDFGRHPPARLHPAGPTCYHSVLYASVFQVATVHGLRRIWKG